MYVPKSIQRLFYWTIILSITLLTSACGFKSYDSFQDVDIILESDKSTYMVGEKIDFNLVLKAKKNTQIRLYKDLTRSVDLRIRKVGGAVDLNDDFYLEKKNNSGKEIEIFNLKSGEEINKIIEGKTYKNEQTGKIVFDFGQFGFIEKNNIGTYRIWFYLKPIKPKSIDSLEDYSNSIDLEIK